MYGLLIYLYIACPVLATYTVAFNPQEWLNHFGLAVNNPVCCHFFFVEKSEQCVTISLPTTIENPTRIKPSSQKRLPSTRRIVDHISCVILSDDRDPHIAFDAKTFCVFATCCQTRMANVHMLAFIWRSSLCVKWPLALSWWWRQFFCCWSLLWFFALCYVP